MRSHTCRNRSRSLISRVRAADGLHAYDTATWRSVRDVPGAFLSAGFSPDGRTLIAGAGDGTLHVLCPWR